MKRFTVLAAALCGAVTLSAQARSPLPSLPKWSESDALLLKEGKLVVGQALLAEEFHPEKGEEAAEVVIEAVEGKPGLEQDGLLGFDAYIDGPVLEKYFSAQPTSPLVDPQELLSMQERADLQHALQSHAEQSEVPIYVYLFDSAQQLGEEYAPSEVYQTVFEEGETPVVLVYYFLDAPERAQFLLRGGAADAVPEWQVRELLWNAAHKAKLKSEAFDQLDDFVGQLSMRLFWIEEIIQELSVVEPEPVAEEAVEERPVGTKEKLETFWGAHVQPYLQTLLLVLGAVTVAVMGIVFLVLRRRFHFPEPGSAKRLGGEVGGRFGGVLSYRSQQVPPSDQKAKFKKDFF